MEANTLYGKVARRLSLATDGTGRLFAAVIKADRDGATLRVEPVRTNAAAGPQTKPLLVTSDRAILDVALSCDQSGRLLTVWNQLTDEGAKLRYAICRRDGWSRPATVAPLTGSALTPVIARDGRGRIWCAFVSNSLRQHHIFVSWFSGGIWSWPVRISDGEGYCMAPAISPFGEGVRVVWDARIDETFGIYMRELDTETRVPKHEPQAVVAEADTLLANPAIVALDSETSLVVYERAQDHWGRRNRPPTGASGKRGPAGSNFLLSRRRLCGAIIGPQGIASLQDDLHRALGGPAIQTGATLGRDIEGGLHLAWRQLASADPVDPTCPLVVATAAYRDGGWTEPRILTGSEAMSDSPTILARDGEGTLLVGYIQREHYRYRVRAATLDREGKSPRPAAGAFEAMEIPEFRTPQPIRPVTIAKTFDSPRLLWGDLHRHSNLSACKSPADGSPADAYRYALMAMDLDFIAVTDHTSRLTTPDTLVDGQALADAYNLPGFFTAFAAFEASLEDGDGHMVALAEGSAPLMSKARTRAGLLSKLDPQRTVVVPHHTAAAGMSYDWTGHDERLAPVAEIYQPYRTSSEAVDAPAPRTAWRRKTTKLIADRTLAAAWAAGLKIGVVASSDHLTTGGAFAGVWAAGNTRREILDALRRRRCYGATDRIELAFWADEHFMGEDFTVGPNAKIAFKVRCRGTAVIGRIELLIDNEVVHTFRPASKRLTATVKRAVASGTHVCRLRVFQIDGHMAWSSPIWITG